MVSDWPTRADIAIGVLSICTSVAPRFQVRVRTPGMKALSITAGAIAHLNDCSSNRNGRLDGVSRMTE
ncbi:hypothetical protein CBM2626_B60031 [Cupriavidus taiwanensis]|nr:hypothetical protein CBM2626_B60031 [Cupriavidus taiwanensis]